MLLQQTILLYLYLNYIINISLILITSQDLDLTHSRPMSHAGIYMSSYYPRASRRWIGAQQKRRLVQTEEGVAIILQITWKVQFSNPHYCLGLGPSQKPLVCNFSFSVWTVNWVNVFNGHDLFMKFHSQGHAMNPCRPTSLLSLSFAFIGRPVGWEPVGWDLDY